MWNVDFLSLVFFIHSFSIKKKNVKMPKFEGKAETDNILFSKHLKGASAQVLPSAYSRESSEMDQLPHFTQPDQLNRLIVKPPGQILNIRCAASGNTIGAN